MTIREEIRKDFEGLSRREILEKLKEAEFRVKLGTGKIIILNS